VRSWFTWRAVQISQFTINLLFAVLQIQLAFKLPVICNPLLFAYNFNWHSNCLQFTINLLFVALQLQVAFKLPVICNPLLFAYNFNWHSNCLICSTTTSTGIQISCNLQSVALCLQLQMAYQLPAICTPLLSAYNFQRYSKARNLQPVCSLPATTTSL